MDWRSVDELWPDQPKFDAAEWLRNSESALKEMRAHLDKIQKFIDETPAILRSDASFEVKRRRRQQCMLYLYGGDYYGDDPPDGEVVQFRGSTR